MKTTSRRRYRQERRWKITEVWVPLCDNPYQQRHGWRYCRHYEKREDIGGLWRLVTSATCETGILGG